MSGPADVEEDVNFLTVYGDALADALSGPREEIGERFVGTFLTFWENPQVRPRFVAAIRSAATSGENATPLRDFMSAKLFARVAEKLQVPSLDLEEVAEMLKVPPLNLNAAAAQVMGVAMMRYVMEMEPLASASADEIRDLIAPTIQRYLSA
jgi:tetracycline repressor-like protein